MDKLKPEDKKRIIKMFNRIIESELSLPEKEELILHLLRG